VHPFGNPHYWLNPENGRAIARAVAATLTALDPAGKADYEARLAAFEARLDAKEREWKERMAPFAGTRMVTYHSSWPSFLDYFGLVAAGFVEPKAGIPPTPSHTLEIINLVREEAVPVILVEPYFDTKTPDYIAEKTGAKVIVLPPSVGGVPEIHDYFELFDHDIGLLTAALGGVR
jgi:ABC-type Zn uptake system ZnuABC Zn-binding protein ZnuA